jgi:hypothetical protein
MKQTLTILALFMSLSAFATANLDGTLEFLSEVGAEKKVDDKTFMACDLVSEVYIAKQKGQLVRSPAVIEQFGRKLKNK